MILSCTKQLARATNTQIPVLMAKKQKIRTRWKKTTTTQRTRFDFDLFQVNNRFHTRMFVIRKKNAEKMKKKLNCVFSNDSKDHTIYMYTTHNNLFWLKTESHIRAQFTFINKYFSSLLNTFGEGKNKELLQSNAFKQPKSERVWMNGSCLNFWSKKVERERAKEENVASTTTIQESKTYEKKRRTAQTNYKIKCLQKRKWIHSVKSHLKWSFVPKIHKNEPVKCHWSFCPLIINCRCLWQ